METGLIAIGAGLAVGLAALATGYAQARIGAAAMGLIAEKPELAGRAILLVAIPETLVILGFAVAAMTIVLLCPPWRSTTCCARSRPKPTRNVVAPTGRRPRRRPRSSTRPDGRQRALEAELASGAGGRVAGGRRSECAPWPGCMPPAPSGSRARRRIVSLLGRVREELSALRGSRCLSGGLRSASRREPRGAAGRHASCASTAATSTSRPPGR